MKIEAPSLKLDASQNFELTLDDRGGAAVAIKVEIWKDDTTKLKDIFYTNTQQPKPKTVALSPGKYDMFVTIAATKKRTTTGSTYRSSVTLTDAGTSTEICTARGSVPASRSLDLDAEVFELNVA